jgi:hypothetical protein
MTPKEKRERAAFGTFCGLRGNLSPDDFDYIDCPDFVKRDRSLGVELVEYHRDADTSMERGSSRRRGESQRARVEGLARQIYEAKGGKGQVLMVDFNEEILRTADQDAERRIAEDLAELARMTEGTIAEIDGSSLPEPLQLCVYHVTSYPDPSGGSPEWLQVEAEAIDARVEALQATIASKEARVAEYRKNAPSVALLVHASTRGGIGVASDEGRFSTCGVATDEIKEHAFESSFDDVYLLDLDSGELVELKVRSPS